MNAVAHASCVLSARQDQAEKSIQRLTHGHLVCAVGLRGELPVACSADTGRVLLLWDGAAEPLHVVHRLRLPAGALLPREWVKSCTL